MGQVSSKRVAQVIDIDQLSLDGAEKHQVLVELDAMPHLPFVEESEFKRKVRYTQRDLAAPLTGEERGDDPYARLTQAYIVV